MPDKGIANARFGGVCRPSAGKSPSLFDSFLSMPVTAVVIVWHPRKQTAWALNCCAVFCHSCSRALIRVGMVRACLFLPCDA